MYAWGSERQVRQHVGRLGAQVFAGVGAAGEFLVLVVLFHAACLAVRRVYFTYAGSYQDMERLSRVVVKVFLQGRSCYFSFCLV